MDMFLHMNCGDNRKLGDELEWYGAQLRDLFRLAERVDPAVSFTILSDHGMTPVEHHYDLVRDLESLGFRMPTDYLAVYDSTMARFWIFDEGIRWENTERLNALPCGRILG